MTEIDPDIRKTAAEAVQDELEWANLDQVSPWQAVEALHVHRLAARLEGEGWHGYPEAKYDHKTPRRNVAGMAYNRADLYAANADRNVRLWLECKRMGISEDGSKAGFAGYDFDEFKRDWAWDFIRLAQGPADRGGWTIWRVFYLSLRGASDKGLFLKLPVGPGASDKTPEDCEELAKEIRGLSKDTGALDLLRGMILAAQSYGIHVQPAVQEPIELQGHYWFPLLFAWSTRR